MASFFLCDKTTKLNKSKIIDYFNKIDINNYYQFDLGRYNLILFKKVFINDDNFIHESRYSIFVTGSLAYKKFGYKDSIRSLLDDYIQNKIDVDELFGNYTIIFYDNFKNLIKFLFDPLYLKNVYIDFKDRIISNNFFSIIESRPYFYQLNILALLESVFTGNLIPPDTYAKNIERLCKVNVSKLNISFKNVSFVKSERSTSSNFSNRKEAVDFANFQLENYFDSMRNLDLEYGTHVGLTGGFDSRLLLIHAKRKLKNLNTNSFFRKKSLEYAIAKELANVSGLEFISYENTDYKENRFINPELSLLFFDGQVRSQNYIHEPFSHPDYAAGLYKHHLVGFHGCGGEQYRNADRFKGKMNLYDYVLYEWLFRQSGNVYLKNNLKHNLVDNIIEKIRTALNFQGTKIDLLTLKRIQNEIWNPANRVTRINAINQQMFYFAPFTEWQLSFSAYSYVPYLGINSKFQIEMMKRLDSDLNDLKTNYGYTINDGPSIRENLISQIASGIPRKYLLQIHRKIKRTNNLKRTSKVRNLSFALSVLAREMDVKKLLTNKYIRKNLLAYEIVIKKLKLS